MVKKKTTTVNFSEKTLEEINDVCKKTHQTKMSEVIAQAITFYWIHINEQTKTDKIETVP